MERRRVLVTRRIPQPGIDLLTKVCDVEINEEERVLSKEEIINKIRDKDGLLCLLTDEIDEEILRAGSGLKGVANYAVGFNNVDIAVATQLGIPVSNTPGVLTETTADLAWALLMAAARRVVEADGYTRAGKYAGWSPNLFLGVDVYGRTLGLVGLGRIGQAVARRAQGFDMQVLYYDLSRLTPEEEQALNVTYCSLPELLKKSDFVSLHVPLTADTKYLIGKDELTMMKDTAVLVNTARGPIVHEAALVEALKNKKIFAAGLDVYEDEPDLAAGLAQLDNVVVVPHIASASVQTRTKMATMAAENLLMMLAGKCPPNIVNREIYEG
ncbi:MAG: D-glycerate dehydrogenase [Limnochordia bacterium]|jgi:glyoxylate reductase|nr:D-glycerate dehydrogenase [Limnochordia bacterium]MDD2628878.1 D-glycerate dehydrogenase [Limnochordia bacterium]MDD4516991.1 D-glycerate dehydrogenase [Limnochordia bacterium]